MLSLGRILISNLVVANLLVYSLPGIILPLLGCTFFTVKVFCMRYHHFCKDENSTVTQIKHKINSEYSNEIIRSTFINLEYNDF